MGSPKLIFEIVMVAALAAGAALVASAVPVGLAVMVAVPVSGSWVVLLEPPPHAVASAATRHMAAQNKPNLFIVTPLDWTFGKDTIIDPIWFKEKQFRGLYRVAVNGPIGWQTGCGGLPVLAHPLPVATYVAPGRYG
jgi:hypothetical protein